jgi:hypothetical protein
MLPADLWLQVSVGMSQLCMPALTYAQSHHLLLDIRPQRFATRSRTIANHRCSQRHLLLLDIVGLAYRCPLTLSIVAIFIIERVGRRPLMLWCALGMGFTMVLLAGLYIETGNGNQAAQAVAVLCLFVFNCWFTIGWLGMSW